MTTISGKNGKVDVGSSTLLEITSWNFTTTSNNSVWGSSSSSGYKKRQAGTKDMTGNIAGQFDTSSPIYNTMEEGDDVTLKLYLNASLFYEVPALIESFNLSIDVDNGAVVGWTSAFGSNGAWTKPT